MENMERFNRLTEKNKYDIYCPKKEVSILDLSAKLGQLEDLMEELNIDNVEELGKYIHDLNIYVGAYANDPPEKTQQIVKDLNTVIDLRKELGCPLEVVFEAIKEGIIFEHNVIHQTMKSKSTHLFYFQNKWIIRAYVKIANSENAYDRYLKDYKKTWWLPSDKEWKDE